MLTFLEKTYVLSSVKPFFANKLKEITKTPKINFIDPGLRNHLVGDFRSLEDRTDDGGLVEMTAGAELLKLSYGVQHWRDKQKREVDIVAHFEHQITALEIKLRQEQNTLPHLHFFSALYLKAKTFLAYAKPMKS
jgi:predicted AAA+ superfamily ATPase